MLNVIWLKSKEIYGAFHFIRVKVMWVTQKSKEILKKALYKLVLNAV